MCHMFPILSETACQLERQMAKTMDDAFVPECRPDGNYADVQCFEHEGFAKQCWCVTKDGQEIQGTRASDGEIPDCTATSVNKKGNKMEQQHDQEAKLGQSKHSQNQKATEVEIEVMVNDTEPGVVFV